MLCAPLPTFDTVADRDARDIRDTTAANKFLSEPVAQRERGRKKRRGSAIEYVKLFRIPTSGTGGNALPVRCALRARVNPHDGTPIKGEVFNRRNDSTSAGGVGKREREDRRGREGGSRRCS